MDDAAVMAVLEAEAQHCEPDEDLFLWEIALDVVLFVLLFAILNFLRQVAIVAELHDDVQVALRTDIWVSKADDVWVKQIAENISLLNGLFLLNLTQRLNIDRFHHQ